MITDPHVFPDRDSFGQTVTQAQQADEGIEREERNADHPDESGECEQDLQQICACGWVRGERGREHRIDRLVERAQAGINGGRGRIHDIGRDGLSRGNQTERRGQGEGQGEA